MADAEYFIQLFLFGATLFCYILLVVFIIYGAYFCCIRTCLKVRRRRQLERKQQQVEDNPAAYCGQTHLINPFQRDNKATIVPSANANTTAIPPQTGDTLGQDSLNANTQTLMGSDNPTHFVDRKYYEIFVA